VTGERDRLGLLREHDFRQLFVATTVSQVSMLALPLAAVLPLLRSPLRTMRELPTWGGAAHPS